jgi:hypothetical protein
VLDGIDIPQASACARSDHQDKALEAGLKLEELARYEYVPARSFGLPYIELGNMDEAFRWMNKGIDYRESFLSMLKTSPKFDVLREDARFDEFLRRIGLGPLAGNRLSTAGERPE